MVIQLNQQRSHHYFLRKEKGGGCEEDILPVGGKSEEASDLKKYLKML